ncbi:unnamed protein product [Candidula unifasciata]|uniref:alpha-mannosidase n=1 Tax=Candidula unifasciata TaxID=100452 RepID=A0A8S3YPK7_9EUPU|nr:unnamed protein product [Candidula unifasciata]
MDHVPFKHKRTTLERAEKFISPDYFTDINLRSRLYTDQAGLESIQHYAAPDRVPYTKAMEGKYQPAHLGQSFGPVWSTHWFRLEVVIPSKWVGKEVHLLWNSGSEALVWCHGEPRQGLSGDNNRISYIISYNLDAADLQQTVYIEMACNHLFGIGNLAIVKTDDEKKTFTLSQAELAVFDRDVFGMILDIEILHDIAKEFPEDSQRGYQALYAVNDIINHLDVRDRSTYRRAQEMAKTFFHERNGQSQHTLYAMGHAHIDTAWLWPYAETIRKCARSWSCTLRLMEKYPEFIFTCSQAQQYAWVKEHYPTLWQEICLFIQKGQFVPVGGTWVEMDGNIPSCEACIRQFLYGQNFFLKEFGCRCKEFWLPDTFGYSAQFPQILRHCGITRFLTQKLSWSLVNKFPHHTFHWEGIDGSSVLAHFPPGDSYEMKGRVGEMLKTVKNFKDKGRSNRSAFLFGYGDGGHGPSEDMLERLQRLQDCDGLPKVKLASPDEFFSSIERENTNLLCRWRGELYLELHNGTYTTWAKVKKYNRQCEVLLQELEAVATMACVRVPDFPYPHEELDRLWKLLLLNQFHDVLPGSSINQVFQDAVGYYQDIERSANALINKAVACCAHSQASEQHEMYVVNTQGYARHELVELPASELAAPAHKKRRAQTNSQLLDGSHLVEVQVPPLCIKPISQCLVKQTEEDLCSQLRLYKEDDHFVLSNGQVRAELDSLGRLVSLTCFDKRTNSNQFILYDDVPLYWDAWDVMDYHLETRQPIVTAIERTRVISDSSNARVSLEFSLKISEESYLRQEIFLDACSPYVGFNTEVTWRENRKFLKVEFPTTVHTTQASYDIQSGFLQRPNHYNTSWDSARFEVCGHKWADLSEHNFGVAVINNCKYGYSAVDRVLRLSLLRSPKSPDPQADMGVHTFSYAIMPHSGNLQEAGVIHAAQSFNCPLRVVTSGADDLISPALFVLDTRQVLVQAVKMAEDRSRTIILRVHEAYGGSTKVKVTTPLPLLAVHPCNGLEEALHDWDQDVGIHFVHGDQQCQFEFTLTAFQIISLRCVM